jgi:hypothetical protein
MNSIQRDPMELAEEPNHLLFNPSYYASLKTSSNMSDPSIVSSVSSLTSQRYSDITHSSIEPSLAQPNNLDEFDIIDNLDFEDIDDNLIGKLHGMTKRNGMTKSSIDQEMTHQQREAIVQELFVSEKEYVNKLELVVSSFIMPLRNKGKPSTFSFLGKKAPCTEREMGWLFGNFEDIGKLHTENLSNMSER